MQKFLNYLNKFNTPPVYGIICLVFGICFIALPDIVTDILIAIAGVLVILVSVMKLTLLLSKKGGGPFYTLEIIKVALYIFFGVTLISVGSNIAGSITSMFGVYLAVTSGIKIYSLTHERSFDKDKDWWIETVTSILLLVFGLWLLIYPAFPKIMSGVALIILGIKFLSPIISKKKNANRPYYDGKHIYTDDFTDRSDDY